LLGGSRSEEAPASDINVAGVVLPTQSGESVIAMALQQGTRVDRMLRPVHRWVWGDFDRRVRKLIAFSRVEGDGGRDILRAAELTPDPLLRRLYLEHAIDELRHADLFRQRSAALLQLRSTRSKVLFNTDPLPGGHGLDDLSIEGEPDHRLLAFLHVAEKAAAGRFAIYRDVVADDPSTRAIFEEILRDEVFHMNYTYTQLARVLPKSYRRQVWQARASRLWKRYVRVAAAVAGVLSTAILTSMYFIVLAPFAWLARRAERREPVGWSPIPQRDKQSPTSQY
jgi:rubrerythrin